jgi:mono/diheme cytochrome c family protein
MIVRRGFRRAASFNDDRLRQAPVGHFFDAITNGWGAMPSYAPQIPPEDRWAVTAYIRALQLSQQSQANEKGQAPESGGGHK